MNYEFASEISKKLTFTDEADQDFYNACQKFFSDQWETKRDVRCALSLISMHNRRYKRLRPEMLDFAYSVLVASQHIDALAYYGVALIHNTEPLEAKERMSALRDNLSSQNAKAFSYLFDACISWSLGEMTAYTAGIKKFFSEKPDSFNPYLAIPASSVWVENNPPSYVENTIADSLVTEVPEGKFDYIISVSCDEKYYCRYADLFLRSLENLADNFFCHISIVDSLSSGNSPSTLDSRIKVVEQNLEPGDNIGPVSSAIRYIHASRIRAKCDCPVVVMDFDTVVLKSLLPLLSKSSGCDVGFRMLGRSLPWQKITAGFSVFNNTHSAKDYLQTCENFFRNSLHGISRQWWIDQNALECAYRFGREKIHYLNVMADLSEYMAIPTGTDERKLIEMRQSLERAISESSTNSA